MIQSIMSKNSPKRKSGTAVLTAVDVVHCTLIKYADDTKGVHKIDDDEDAARLQTSLDNLYKWSCDWQMLFNLDKCHVLHFGHSNPRKTYTINNHELLHVEEEKDLGVIISSSCCTPSRQVSAAALKANQVLGQLLRAITYRDRHTFIRLYQQYVRSHLECSVQAWCPWLQQDIELLENVQRRAVRTVSGLSGSYEEKLKQLKMYSLQDRRTRGDMIETYKIVNRIEDVEPSTFFSIASDHHNHATRQAVTISDDGYTTTPANGLLRGQSRSELRANFFTHRVISNWNSLPSTIKNSLSVNEFKNKYDKLHLDE
jgi:ribonuclease P/MRP protein subunit RPP40